MNTAEFQSQIIDRLDRVVAGAEALMMDGHARTVADFERLKSEIRGLLDVVTVFERQCHGGRDLQSVKETMAALKRTVETERVLAEAQAAGLEMQDAAAEEHLSFGFEVLPEPAVEPEADMPSVESDVEPVAEVSAVEPMPEPVAEPTTAAPAHEAEADLPAVEPVVESVAEASAADPMPEPVAEPTPVSEPTPVEPVVEARKEAPKTIEPELGLQFDDTPGEPEPTPVADEIFEAIKQENLAQFSVREEDQPQSYITQLTAMAQAQVKGEQDMSGVAVASTARPDTAPEPVSSGDSLMESLRSTRANLNGGQLRTIVDKFKAPQTIYDIQHTRTVDLKMAIGVNEKYLLTRELFGDNIKEYTDAVSRLNEAKDASAAKLVWQAMAQQRAWDENSLAYVTFFDLLKRRFPDLA